MVDGFPRNKENFEGFIKVFGASAKIKSVLYLDLAQEVCISRITERSKNSGRVDDNQETLKKRFDVFFNETVGNLVNLEKVTQVIKVNADGDKKTVFQRVCVDLDKLYLTHAPKNSNSTCVKSYFKSYLLYFLLATGSAFTSYIVYRRLNKK